MSTARNQAIGEAIDREQSGRTSFYYVDTSLLERKGITAYKTTAGDNFMRIIPPLDEKTFWAKEVWVHRNIGSDGVTFICLKKMFNKPCPICELVDEMRKNDPEDKKIDELAPGKRYLMFVYDVKDDSSMEKGLRWYDAPGIVVSNIMGLSKDKRTKEIIDVSDPIEGRDIEFVRKGTGLGSKYEAFNLVKTEPLPKEWCEDVPEFDSVLLIPTYEQVKKELTGSPSTTNINTEPAVGQQVATAPEAKSEPKQEQPKTETEQPVSRRSVRGRGNAPSETNPSIPSVEDRLNAVKRRVLNRNNGG